MEGNGAEPAGVADLLAAELDAAAPPGRTVDLVLAALLGADELSAVLSGTQAGRPAPAPKAASAAHAAGLYLQSIVVEGFRGIGPQAALRLQPGPGLTIVAGRNGSGKSSFAEAAELALTGDNKRWSGRSAVWKEGWRNLHTAGDTKIRVDLVADGQPGTLRVTRDWAAGAVLDDAVSYAQARGEPRRQLTDLNWSHPLELFRPFLSYSELGALVSGRPADMYDALQAILGLDQLIEAEKLLDAERKRLDEPSKRADKELRALRDRLEAHPDPRAAAALDAVRRRPWKLDVVEALAVGGAAADDPAAARLSRVAAITVPSAQDVAEVVDQLQAANRRVAELAPTPAADALRLAGLLTEALDHQAGHPDEPCPVCGGRVLDEDWAAAARAEVERLTEVAGDADDAHRTLGAAVRAARDLAGAPPPVLAEDLGPDVDATAVRATWRSWSDLALSGSAGDLIASAGELLGALAAAVTEFQAQAAAVARSRSKAWQPVGAALAAWAEVARSSERAAADLADVVAARNWLRTAGQEIRDARMAALTETSSQVWGMLRQESNIDLGPVRLAGVATQRHVSVAVTVDGVDGAALSVMSQGELHALGLALFLPRAKAPESPFRFMVIDDPVQSMDPAKVDGLARLLASVGETRQVVVFTHDDRLPDAIRRLQLRATIWEVTRREGSVVELTRNEDPVFRFIDDARAMARTDDLSEGAREVVVAGFCRSALEAACHEAIRARRFKAGERHADVDRELADAQTLHEIMTLAVLDDVSKGGQLADTLRSRYGGRAAFNAFRAAKDGTHEPWPGNLKDFVEETRRLADAIRR